MPGPPVQRAAVHHPMRASGGAFIVEAPHAATTEWHGARDARIGSRRCQGPPTACWSGERRVSIAGTGVPVATASNLAANGRCSARERTRRDRGSPIGQVFPAALGFSV